MDLFLSLMDKDKTAILVTHDVDEAIYLANRIIVFGSEPCEIILDLPKNTDGIKEKLINAINNAKTDL